MSTVLDSIRKNVHEICGTNIERIQADISHEVYDYLFRHVIAYTHGSRQALVCFFFQRLYEECQELGISKVWDEDNEQKVLAIVNRLNFKEHPPTPEPKVKNERKRKPNISTDSEPRSS